MIEYLKKRIRLLNRLNKKQGLILGIIAFLFSAQVSFLSGLYLDRYASMIISFAVYFGVILGVGLDFVKNKFKGSKQQKPNLKVNLPSDL